MVGMAMGVGIILWPLHGKYYDESAIIYLVDRNANSIRTGAPPGLLLSTWRFI